MNSSTLFFRIMSSISVLTLWVQQAMADGKITLVEAVDLASKVCKIWGIRDEIELPAIPPVEELAGEDALNLTSSDEKPPTKVIAQE